MRGKGCSWSRVKNGCEVRFYGWANEREHETAHDAAEEVRLAVKAIEDAATIMISDANNPLDGVRVSVRVTGDAVAAFEGGPTHRAAVARAITAARRKMDDCAWTAIRLGGASSLPGGET